MSSPFASAAGDAAAGRYNWEYTCQHCHGVPQPYKAAAFSDYDTTANKLAVYASDPAAITRSATVGYTVPAGNSSDKVEPGQNTNLAMGTWAGDAWNRLGTGSTPTQYAADFAAYFATFFQVPGAPTIGPATVSNSQATVNFTAPKSDLPVTSYTVTANPGGLTATGRASPITVAGLASGTNYTFTVTATSNAGTGKSSAASNVVTPVGGQQAVAVHSAPAATAVPTSVTPSVVAKPTVILPSPPAALPGRTPGVAPVPVVAPQAKPTQPVSQAQRVVPGYVPTTPSIAAAAKVATGQPASGGNASASIPAPTITAAKPGSAEARVFFTVPQDAVPLISGYTVVAYSGGKPTGINATGSSSPIKVAGLTNGTDYVFYVFANGKSGTRVPSTASNVVTPLSIFGE